MQFERMDEFFDAMARALDAWSSSTFGANSVSAPRHVGPGPRPLCSPGIPHTCGTVREPATSSVCFALLAHAPCLPFAATCAARSRSSRPTWTAWRRRSRAS